MEILSHSSNVAPSFFGMGIHVEPQDVINFDLIRELLGRRTPG